MKKIYKLYSLILLLIMTVFIVFSLGGNNVNAASYDTYYSSVNTTSGETLVSSLTNIISNGYKQLGYSNRLSAYPTTDMKPGTNYLWDMYSNENYTIDDNGESASTEGLGFNTEHSIPQSWFDKAEPMRSDLFHIYPTDIRVNSIRGSYLYGETDNPTETTNNGSKLGPSSFSGYNGVVFEPIDDYKGDFARTYFYMATRYSSKLNGWTAGESKKVFKGSYPYLTEYAINLFTKWHNEDPVSEKEINRNNAVYEIQKNRNPYIDHPEYVNTIWGGEYGSPTETKYKVTYSVGSGVSFSYTDSNEYTSGSLINAPTINPIKVGFTFLGWTDNNNTNNKWDFASDKISKNLTLYPLWKVSSIVAFTSDCSKITTQLMANYTSSTSNEVIANGYTLVSDVSELSASDRIIIVNTSSGMALSKTQNNNNRGVATVNISNNFINEISSDVQVITLENGTKSGSFGFNVGNGYLYAASSGSNWLRTQESLNNNASFKIEISSGVATIKAQGANTRNQLMYNSSANIFSCYASGQQSVAIYKETSGDSLVTKYDVANVGIRFSYYVPLDIYNEFIDEYDFGFEYGQEFLSNVILEQVTYNSVASVKVSYSFDSIKDYTKEYSVRALLVDKKDKTNKSYGKTSTAYSVKSLAEYYIVNSVNDTIVKKYSSLLNSIVE